MIRTIFVVMALVAGRAAADEPTELSVHVGKMTLNMGKAAVGGQATSAGSAYGVRYLHSTSPFLAWGVDADFLRPGDKTTDSLISNMRASTSVDSASLFGVARVGPIEEVLRPYFLLGLGIHFTSIRLEAQPKEGFVWVDTGTGERRKLIESGGRGAAVKIQGGADYAFNDNFLAGMFLSYNYMGSATYEATNEAKAMGLNSVTGSMSAITFGLNLAARF